MKTRLVSILPIVLVSIMSSLVSPVSAYDFEQDGVYYNIVSKRAKQIEVTHWEESTGQWGIPKRVHHAPCACCSHDACATDKHHHHHETLEEQKAMDSLAVIREKTAYTGAVVVPEKVKYKGRTYTVTGVGDGAFYKRKQLTSVTLPTSIRYIGKSSFESCVKLDTVNLSSSLDSICFAAFRNCILLRTLALNDSIRYVDVYAFAGCHSLRSIRWPLSVTAMAGNVFWDCKNLKTIVVPHQIPPTIEVMGLKMNFRNIRFLVTEEALPNFKANEQWSDKNLIVAE